MNEMTPGQRPIAKSSSALLISQLSLAALNFVITAYLLRLLSRDEVAVTAVIEILTAIFSFSTLGLLNVATQQAPSALQTGKGREQAFSLVKCALVYQTIALVVFGGLSFIFSTQLSQLLLKTPGYAWAVRLLVPGAMASVWFSTLQGVAQIKDDFYLIALWGFVAGLLRPLLSIPGYWLFGFAGYLSGVLVSALIPLVGMGWALRQFIINDVAPAPFWETFRYGLPFYLRNFLRFGYMQFDQTIVALMLTPSALASYNAAHRFRKHITIVSDAFQGPIGIRMAALRGESEEMQANFFRKATRYTLLLIVPLTIFVAAASPWLMSIFGGAKYAADWPLLTIMSIGQAGYALYVIYGSAVFARFKPWASLLIDGLNGGVNYLFGPLLILLMAQYGVATSQLLGFAVGVLCAGWLLHRLPGYQYDRESLRLIGLPLLLGCGTVILGEVVYFRWWSIPFFLALGGIAFFILTGRRFSGEDWFHLRTLIPLPFLPLWLKFEGRFHKLTTPKQIG